MRFTYPCFFFISPFSLLAEVRLAARLYLEMPTVLSQPNVRYSALATHAIFCLFGWWIASRLLYTSERLGVNFNPNKAVLMTVLLGILCMLAGSLGVVNTAKYSNDLEDHMSDSGSGTTVTSLHSVLCYLTIAFAACVTVSRYFGAKQGSPSETGRSRCWYFRPSRSLVVGTCLLIFVTGFDGVIGGCGDRFVVSHNHGQPVYTHNSAFFCLAHYHYELQALVFFALASAYGNAGALVYCCSPQEIDRRAERVRVALTEAILLFVLGVCEIVLYLLSTSLDSRKGSPQHLDRVSIFVGGMTGVVFACSQLPGIVLAVLPNVSQRSSQKAFELGASVSFFGYGLIHLILTLGVYYRDAIYFYQPISQDFAAGKIQEIGLILCALSVFFIGALRFLEKCNSRIGEGADDEEDVQERIENFSEAVTLGKTFLFYAAGLSVLFAQPTSARFISFHLKMGNASGLGIFVFLSAAGLSSQEYLSVWLTNKLGYDNI